MTTGQLCNAVAVAVLFSSISHGCNVLAFLWHLIQRSCAMLQFALFVTAEAGVARCEAGLEESGGTCVAKGKLCGQKGQKCCAGKAYACGDWLACTSGKCSPCGQNKQPICKGMIC